MLEQLLTAAVQSGALLLAVWAIFRAFPAIPANAKAWIWRLAFLKPLACLAPFAVVTLRVLPAPVLEPVEPVTAPVAMSLPAAVTVSPPAELPAAPAPFDPWLVAWIFGTAAVAGHGALGWARARRVTCYADPVTEPAYLRMLGDLAKRAGMNAPPRLLSSPDLDSAMLLSGNIVLPQTVLESGPADDVRLMMAHEVAHLARRDLPWYGLIWLVQAVFFFNPAVWLAARAARLDHESATDRYAAQLAAVPIQTYADMLLRATVVARISLVPGILPMAESFRTIHRRLEAMKHFNSQPSRWRQTAIGAIALATAGLLPSYQLAQAEPPQTVVKPAVKKAPKPAPKKTSVKVAGKGEKTVKTAKGTWTVVPGKKGSKTLLWERSPNAKGASTTRISYPVESSFPAGGSGQNRAAGSSSHEYRVETVHAVSGQSGAPGASGSSPNRYRVETLHKVSGQNTNGGQTSGSSSGSGESSTTSSGLSTGGSSTGGSSTSVSAEQGFGGSGSVSSGGEGFGGSSGTVSSSGQGFGGGSTNASGGGQRFGGSGTVNRGGQGIGGGSSLPGSEGFGQVNLASNSGPMLIDCDFNQFDAREALRLLFRKTYKSYSFDPRVQGIVTLSTRNVTFEAVLQNMLRQVNAQVKVVKGVYMVSVKPQPKASKRP